MYKKKSKLYLHKNILLPFIFLNLLMLLPGYIPTAYKYQFFPTPSELISLSNMSWYSLSDYLKELFIIRDNLDLFRISTDVLFSICLVFWTQKIRFSWIFKMTASISIFLIFISQTYDAISLSLFSRNPILAADFPLFRSGLHFLVDTYGYAIHISFFITFVVLSLLFYLCFLSIQKITFALSNHKKTAFMIHLLLFTGLYSHYRLGVGKNDPFFQWKAHSIHKNFTKSMHIYQNHSNLDASRSQIYQPFLEKNLLHTKPNVFLFIIESYGRMVYDSPRLKEKGIHDLKSFFNKLKKTGVFTSSHWSTSTTYGGASWFASASLLSGVRISTTQSYNYYLDYAKSNPSLINFFKNNGYETATIVPGNSNRTLPTNSFGFDIELNRWQLKYRGTPYGWGKVPDQYTLGKAYDLFLRNQETPIFMSFKGVSSHSPWEEIPVFSHSWKDLDSRGTSILSKNYHDGFLKSLQYEWQILQKFIEQRFLKKNNDIYIIIGDHQPPGLAEDPTNQIMEVPIHILSRDKNYLSHLDSYGFKAGHMPHDHIEPLHHAGFLSLLIGSLAKTYSNKHLTYYPQGISLHPTNVAKLKSSK